MGKFFFAFAEYCQKVPAPFLLFLLVTLGGIVYAPDSWTESIRLTTFRNSHGHWFGLAFLLVVAFTCGRILNYVRMRFVRRRKQKLRQKLLHNLTAQEKGYLVPFVVQGLNTVNAGIEDGIMGGLEAKGIVYRSANAGDSWSGFPFNLQPWARDYLSQHESLLDGT